ncbi:MAG: xanthine dehydrogenase family protein subunit M [Myxococcales bacterium]|nr:xanthine dehydrogenase family protein subunit M [Myxococcota bacterium]MDW8284223.1 xanthine dehydrogenase family protein subunit M [Myxococcales bacterium]
MRFDVAAYKLRTPQSVQEALAWMAAEPGALRPLAGGTDLMVLLAAGKLPGGQFVNLWPLRELRTIEVTSDSVTLGALTTYSDVQAHPVLQQEFPMLVEAARQTGGWAIQNRGTLGGNIGNASPAADSPPALLCYDAELELRSAQGSRWLPYHGFHTGYRQTLLRPDEIIARLRLPRRRGQRLHCYRKVGPRQAQAISKVCFAGCADLEDGRLVSVRIALGGVAPTVVRCPETEHILAAATSPAALDEAAARASLSRQMAPIDDIRSTARYRRRVAENLLGQFVAVLRLHPGWATP